MNSFQPCQPKSRRASGTRCVHKHLCRSCTRRNIALTRKSVKVRPAAANCYCRACTHNAHVVPLNLLPIHSRAAYPRYKSNNARDECTFASRHVRAAVERARSLVATTHRCVDASVSSRRRVIDVIKPFLRVIWHNRYCGARARNSAFGDPSIGRLDNGNGSLIKFRILNDNSSL